MDIDKQNKPQRKSTEAEGTRTVPAYSFGREGPAEITPENVAKFIRNVHYRDHKQNLMIQVFPAPPEVTVVEEDGTVDEERTKARRKEFERVGGYPAMKVALSDIIDWGASVMSPGIAYTAAAGYQLTELRNLPPETFRQNPGLGTVVNHLLPGIVATDEGPQVYQTNLANGAMMRITNPLIIKQAESPEPAGAAYSLPIYPVIADIDFGNKREIQQVNRIGSPIIIPKANDEIDDEGYARLQEWFKKFGKKWGSDTSFLAPPGTEFPNITIRESAVAKDFIATRVRWIAAFFNPTTDLDVSGSAIGASDSGRMEMWANHISSLQNLTERWIEKLFDQVDEWNGYEGYHTQVRLRRPSVDRSAIRLQYMQALVASKAITMEEVRQNAGDILELQDWNPELELQLKEQYPASSVASLFGNTTPGYTRPEDKIMSSTEKQIITANEAARKAIERITGYGE